MLAPIPDFSPGRQEGLDPFAQNPGLEPGRYLFVYLTGRGQASYLFADEPEQPLFSHAQSTIPMGYTQLWLVEWAAAARPAGPRTRRPRPDLSRRLEEEPPREGGWVLIAERGGCVGWAMDLPLAIGAAKGISDRRRTRIAVGRLRRNLTWH